MTISKVGNMLFYIPDFIHEFSEDDLHHTFKGSLRRHLAVEHICYRFMGWLTQIDALPFYRLLCAPIDFLLGLNCNFPKKDVARYVWWSLTKGYYEYLGEYEKA